MKSAVLFVLEEINCLCRKLVWFHCISSKCAGNKTHQEFPLPSISGDNTLTGPWHKSPSTKLTVQTPACGSSAHCPPEIQCVHVILLLQTFTFNESDLLFLLYEQCVDVALWFGNIMQSNKKFRCLYCR